MTPDVSRHPEAERLAEYAEGRLDAGARAEVEAHLAECPVCRTVVMETMAFLDAEPAQAEGAAATVLPFRPRTWLTAAAAVLAVAAALTIAIRVDRPGGLSNLRGDRPELQDLIAAVAGEPTRPVEGRLSGGFKYGPPPSATRGAGDRENSPDVRIAAARVEQAVRESNAPADLSAAAAAYLATGAIDEAIRVLEGGADRQHPDVTNDLAAAYLARASRSGAAADWSLALAAADRAIALDSSKPEPLFNRALALEGLGRTDEARAAWQLYLADDPSSAWSSEAREHLSAMAAPR